MGTTTLLVDPDPQRASREGAGRFDRSAWFVLALAAVLVLLSVAQKAYRLDLPTDGWSSTTNFETDAPLFVENLLGEPSNSDLHPGDLVVAVEGVPADPLIRQVLRGDVPAISHEVGDTVVYTVLRDGEEVDIEILLLPGARIGWAGVLRDVFLANGVSALRFGLRFLLVAFLFLRRPDNGTARLLLLLLAADMASTISWAVTPLSVGDALRPETLLLASFFSHWIHLLLGQPLNVHIILSFPRPDPLLRSGWTLPLLYGVPAAALAAVLLFPALPTSLPFAVVALYSLIGIALVVRMLLIRRGAEETAQVRWFGFGFALWNLSLVAFGLSVVGLVPPTWVAAIDRVPLDLVFLACISVGILWYRMFDIDVVINRSLVYGGLSVGVVGLYTLVVVGVGRLFPAQEGTGLPLVATGLIAVAFNPARTRLQRSVNRLLYGERDDPYAVLRALGQKIEGTTDPSKILPVIIETVAQILRLPYASATLLQGTQTELVAQVGRRSGDVITWPLTHQGEVIGEMNLQTRAGEVFRPAELSLQKTIAQQVSMVAYTLRQSLALQRSLEALVTTREEERLRIRRDLHDGLGPALAGITLKLDAARNHLTNRPEEAAALLLELKRQTQQAIADIRRLVYDLRPPALDQLGFEGALREQVSSSPGSLDVTLRLPALLGSLPPAVEVAGYRIVQEALTNVYRHANAGVCRIEVELGGSLTVTVEDDGIGLPAEYRAGVGLRSMRERAEELGGTFWAGASELGGARVVASLPWSAS